MIRFWTFFLNRTQFSVFLGAVLIVWGGIAVLAIKKESTPEVQIPVGIVTTVLPGASAEDVETLVTDKIEDRVRTISEIDTLTSTSREGLSVIVAEFAASAPLQESIQKLKDEVDKAKPDLPDEAKDPTVSDVNFSDQPIQIISVSADLPFSSFAKLGRDVRRELESVSGVSRVEVSGTREREVSIVVRSEELSRYGLSLPSVIGAIRAANASLPIGSVSIDGIDYTVSFSGDLDGVEDIGNVAIGSVGGLPIYLRDIALVADGVEKASTYSRVSSEGNPSEQALSLSIFKTRSADITSVSKSVRERLEELQRPGELLSGSSVIVSFDQGTYVKQDLTRLIKTGLETVILVTAVLLLTIGWRESLVAALSIPLSFLIAFIGLLHSGNTINVVSLFSLILAIGILVDSGIVITEAIHTRIRTFGDPYRAAVESLREYAWPLIAGTMTTVAVFVPLFFISGIVGKFIASIPFTLIFILLASIFVALGMVPLIAISSFSEAKENRLSAYQERTTERLRLWYAAFLGRILGKERFRRYFTWGLVAAFFLSLALPMVGLVKVEFFPAEESDFVYINVKLPEGTSIGRTDLAVRAVEEELYGLPDIDSIVTTVGASSAFDQSVSSGAKYGNLTVNLVDKEDRTMKSAVFAEGLREKLRVPGAEITVSEPQGGPPTGAPVEITLSGEDFDALETAAIAVEQKLRTVPGALNVKTSIEDIGVSFKVSIDHARLSELGLTASDIASTLRTAVNGTVATTLKGGDKDTDVVVRADLNPFFTDPHEANAASIESISQVPVRTPSGIVLLGSVTEISLAKENATIAHEDGKRVARVTSAIAPGGNAIEVTSAFSELADDIELPEGVSLSVGGENEETDQSFKEMFYAFIAGLLLMFAVLMLEFNSFRFSFYLLSIVPLSITGVMVGLFATGAALSFPSLLGIVALAGVIINHAIILMDAMLLRAKEGAFTDLKDLIIDAAVSRLRPIILTTLTTVVGMIPLAHAEGLWGPLAYTIMFGLSYSLLLTLVFIPILVYRFPGKFGRAFGVPAPEKPVVQESMPIEKAAPKESAVEYLLPEDIRMSA